jgi:catechol 2,3-dioxygenase-like lactoylglutathione lyase family enzyme
LISTTQVQHVGISVRDLNRTLMFYKDVLGIEPQFVSNGSGEELSKAVGVPNAILAFAFLRLGPTILELLEYTSPRGSDYDRQNCDIGAVHVAFQVPDMRTAYEQLVRQGIEFNAPPLTITEGPLAGSKFAYFSDPDGVQLEIFEVGTSA